MESITKRDSPSQRGSLFIFIILIVGLSGIVAQVVLLRELLVSFYGNELTLGVILANWIILEALGVFSVGKFVDKAKNKVNIFIILQVIFCLMLPVCIYLSRVIKPVLGVPFGEAIGLDKIFYSSLFVMLPVSFCHGALFSCGAKIYSLYAKDPAGSIGKIYAWETIGTIIGGIALTYLFIPKLDSFQIAFLISISNLIACLFFFRHISKIFKYVISFLILCIVYLALSGGLARLNQLAINKQWKGLEVLDYRNSIYGNIAVTRKESQHTFFYDGLPVITTPYPDITFVQEFANLPLLFHPSPRDILVISGGAGGIINEILKHPVRKIDYAELDPLIIKMLKEYPSELTNKELSDKRVNIINRDGRFFVRNASSRYDIILIGLSKPADLSTNRIFTEEFFVLAKKRLKDDGILALYLPGSLTYLSRQLQDLNACILNGLKNTYTYVRIIPGDYNIYLASSSSGVMRVSPDLITQRISENNIKPGILVPAYLDYRLDKKWSDWFIRSSAGATKKVNRDFAPAAVYQMLIIWNKQFSAGFARVLEVLGGFNVSIILAMILALTLFFMIILYYKRNLVKLSIAYSIATTGFFGMMMNLILIFCFQVVYGYLYYLIGLLISIFMAGAAAGSIFMARNTGRIKSHLSLFIKIEAAIILFSYLAALMLTGFSGSVGVLAVIFLVLFFISGLLMGLEFSLASTMYMRGKGEVGFTSGLLYFSDLIGGWFAGIIGAVIFLPVLGLFNTCLVIIFIKSGSLLLLTIFRKRLTKALI